MKRLLFLCMLNVVLGLMASHSKKSAYKGADFSAVDLVVETLYYLEQAKKTILESQKNYQVQQNIRFKDLEEQANIFCILQIASSYNIPELCKKVTVVEQRANAEQQRVDEVSYRLQNHEMNILEMVKVLSIHKDSMKKAEETRSKDKQELKLENVGMVKKLCDLAEQVAKLQQKVDSLQQQNDTLQQQFDDVQQKVEKIPNVYDAINNNDACSTKQPSRAPTPSLYLDF